MDLPNWLLESETYTPPVDRETFIEKSILTMLRILSKIHTQSGKKFLSNVHAVFKVACTLLLILLLSLSKSFPFVFTVNVFLLFVISLLPAKEILEILKICFLVALFSLLILLPSALLGNSYSILMITAKITATVAGMNLLSRSARWSAIIGALKYFHIPNIFLFVLDITIKYILMLGDFALHMLYALKLRSVGRNRRKYTSLSGVAGTMFIKSREMAEDMVAAMECRGFTGEYRRCARFRFTFADFLYIFIHAAIVLIFVYFERG